MRLANAKVALSEERVKHQKEKDYLETQVLTDIDCPSSLFLICTYLS